jgi:small neutral amino acid transporter SnatA (MarC family)
MRVNFLKHNPVAAVAIILLVLISLVVYAIMYWDERQIAQYIQVEDCQIFQTLLSFIAIICAIQCIFESEHIARKPLPEKCVSFF